MANTQIVSQCPTVEASRYPAVFLVPDRRRLALWRSILGPLSTEAAL